MRTIDLSGEQGNAYYILGLAKQLCEEQGMEFSPIQYEMKSGDYKNLIDTFVLFFSDWVTFVNIPK